MCPYLPIALCHEFCKSLQVIYEMIQTAQRAAWNQSKMINWKVTTHNLPTQMHGPSNSYPTNPVVLNALHCYHKHSYIDDDMCMEQIYMCVHFLKRKPHYLRIKDQMRWTMSNATCNTCKFEFTMFTHSLFLFRSHFGITFVLCMTERDALSSSSSSSSSNNTHTHRVVIKRRFIRNPNFKYLSLMRAIMH